MKAICWEGAGAVATREVPDARLLGPRDALVRVTLSSVCGSDLHLLGGYVPTMRRGDVIGHEFVGEVVEVGPEVHLHRPGDRVVVSSVIGCGHCFFCAREEWALCDNSNPNAWIPERQFGQGRAGVFGSSHGLGGYAGSHAELVRVPFADQGMFSVPSGVSDEQALFCSDAFPTGYMAADLAGIEPGDVVAVWGCGAVGQLAIKSAYLLGAERVIAIDPIATRLEVARRHGKAEVLHPEEDDVLEELRQRTGGRGPDRCIDAVGAEARGFGLGWAYGRVTQAVGARRDRAPALRQAVIACRKGGAVAVVGAYSGDVAGFPLGAAVNKALTLRMGLQHGPRYIPRLLDLVARGLVDPSYLLTHRFPLEQGALGYRLFRERQDECLRVAFAP